MLVRMVWYRLVFKVPCQYFCIILNNKFSMEMIVFLISYQCFYQNVYTLSTALML